MVHEYGWRGGLYDAASENYHRHGGFGADYHTMPSGCRIVGRNDRLFRSRGGGDEKTIAADGRSATGGVG